MKIDRQLSRVGRWCAGAALLLQGLLTPAQEPPVIPTPLVALSAPGTVQVGDGAVISYPLGDASARVTVLHFVDLLRRTRGITLTAESAAPHAKRKTLIALERKPISGVTELKEAYDLLVSPDGVTISASSDAGLFYGTVTLWQMLTATDSGSGPAVLRCIQIHDAPQLPWRGIMLDSARHMQSLDFIHNLIEWMSLEKLNVLHWHLTDDQGWRLEIKRYPRLTSVGGWRELASQAGKIDPATKKPYPLYGGFYTQQQARELVAYAAERNVMIVPEIEMPGHASAPLAAYPEFGSSDTHLTAPANEHGIFPSLYNVNEETFTFIENVLTEVMQIFPSPYIHVGGDEAIKDQWKASPTVQARMKQLGVRNEEELQSYFIKRIDTFLTAHHRRTLGWDEILEGGLAPNAAVMSWHGVQGGIDAAKQGHDAVLTPTRPLYFNYRQSDAADEAPGRSALNTLSDVYHFDPAPASLAGEERKHILGIQANLWTEYVITEDRDAWMLYPRAAALAEIGWSAPSRRNWIGFEERLVGEMRRYRKLGIGFDPAIFRVRSTETLQQHGITVELANQGGFGSIRYTTDGSPVTPSSTKYEGPLTLAMPTELRAAAFAGEAIPSSELDRQLNAATVRRRYSQELKLCVNDPSIAMEQDPPLGDRPVMLANYKNPCWIYKAADLTSIQEISAGVVSLPYLFREKDPKPPPLGQAHTPDGELEVHLNDCAGALLATLPLAPAAGRRGVTPLHAAIEGLQGSHDLCFKIVRPTANPLWVVDWVDLDPAAVPEAR